MSFKRHHDITIYTSPTSRYSDLAKGYFKDANIDYTEIDVSKDAGEFSKMQELSGAEDTPIVVIDGRMINGFQPDIYDIVLKPQEDKDKDKKE
jgi:arsenate reductase-like glutaredoxin family protein